MSTMTLRKRIALVAVSALGAGLLSVVATPAANAAAAGVIVTNTNSYSNAAAGGVYSVTTGAEASQGLLADVSGTGTAQTGTMYSNGVIVVTTTTASTAQKISISGGVLTKPSEAKAVAGTLSVAADTTSASMTAATNGRLFAAIKANGAGTPLIITGYDNSGTSANWIITLTIVAAGTSGTYSAGNSNIALTASGSAPTTANVDTSGASSAASNACVYMYYALADALTIPLTGASVIAKTTTGLTVGIGGTGTIPVVTGTYSGANYLQVCKDSNNTNKAVSGTVVLTVNGVDVATRSVTIVGQLATITVTTNAISIRNNSGGTGGAYGTASSGAATWVPSHSYVGKDAAGNLVPVTVAVNTSTLDAQVTAPGQNQPADPSNTNNYLKTGGLTFACADTSGANAKVTVKATAADTTTITSNAFTVTCAGDAVNYTAKADKATYNTGDVMTATISFTDKSGKPANDYFTTSVSGKIGTIASGAIGSNVSVPAANDTSTAGIASYKYIIGQSSGTFSVAIDFPNVDNTTYSQSAIVLPLTVASTGASLNDVLKSVVSLIASINKQIVALQKLILKKK